MPPAVLKEAPALQGDLGPLLSSSLLPESAWGCYGRVSGRQFLGSASPPPGDPGSARCRPRGRQSSSRCPGSLGRARVRKWLRRLPRVQRRAMARQGRPLVRPFRGAERSPRVLSWSALSRDLSDDSGAREPARTHRRPLAERYGEQHLAIVLPLLETKIPRHPPQPLANSQRPRERLSFALLGHLPLLPP